MTQPACVSNALDFSYPQYGHNFFVDATPGTGDLYYNGGWHTWLVSGLGAGWICHLRTGRDQSHCRQFCRKQCLEPGHRRVDSADHQLCRHTRPAATTSAQLTVRRSSVASTMASGAVIFGNGFGSTSGDAGIYVMTVDSTGNELFYYLSTGNTGHGHQQRHCLCHQRRPGRGSHHRLRLCRRSDGQSVALRSDQRHRDHVGR